MKTIMFDCFENDEIDYITLRGDINLSDYVPTSALKFVQHEYRHGYILVQKYVGKYSEKSLGDIWMPVPFDEKKYNIFEE